MSNCIKYDEILFSTTRILKNYKRPHLEAKNREELDIMIHTFEDDIKRLTAVKSLFVSCISIVIALIIAIALGGVIRTIVLTIYVLLMVLYFFVTVAEINKRYDFLSQLRYIRENK